MANALREARKQAFGAELQRCRRIALDYATLKRLKSRGWPRCFVEQATADLVAGGEARIESVAGRLVVYAVGGEEAGATAPFSTAGGGA